MRIRLTGLTLLAAATAALSADYEGPLAFRASKILPPQLVKSAHHTIAEEVAAEEFYQEFTVASDFGEIKAEGRTVLRTRLNEVDALARLSDVSKTEVFAKAAGGAVLQVGKGVASVVKDPEATAKGIGGGVKRLGVNLGRKTKRAADSLTEDDKTPQESEKSGGQKAAGAAGSAADTVLGVGGASRRWAQKLGVDPYTTNPVLHAALVDIGRIDAAGSILTKVVVPIPTIASTTASVGKLVWAVGPEELRKRNEAGVVALGTPKPAADRFFKNRNYTPTSQTRLVAALSAVTVPGCADYVDAAAEAADEREALFFVESAEMLAGLHKTAPVTAILPDSRAVVARTGTSGVALLPFDTLRWTERLKVAANGIAARAKKELGAMSLEIRLMGQATAAAKQGLLQAGWQVKEGVADGLSVPPAR
jgi:hypothetical protein